MRAWLACTGAELLARDVADTVGRLCASQAARGLSATAEQECAWRQSLAALRDAVRRNRGEAWTIALEYDLVRLEKRIDAVLLTDRAILCLEFKTSDASPAALAEAEDYALDLRDFHAGSRLHPIVPLLVTQAAPRARAFQPPLLWDGVIAPLHCVADELGARIAWVQESAPRRDALDGAAWLAAPYRPVPTIVEAATMLYARNGVAEIATARADAANLTRTSAAIARAIAEARRDGARMVVFVTGIPGAGKTLCGLNAVFGAGSAREAHAAFLTGNAPLVAVLREALARDAVARGACGRGEAMRRVKAALQNVHRFLEDCATDPARLPPERLIVFDEAQRAWDEAKARAGSRNRHSRLTMSEPAHTLEIMGRRDGWAVVVALIGNGQEINTGEAGLAEWGRVIAASDWRAVAAPRVLDAAEPAQRLASAQPGWLRLDPDLDLVTPIRSLRDPAGAAWVDALLEGRSEEAREIARNAEALPFFVTRDLAALRMALRRLARGRRRAGLVRSSGARRLRAEGLAAEVSADEVPDWFLNSWPDVRASDALECCATEYACQGLELDVVGLAWGGDFLPDGTGWRARRFIGTAWQRDLKEFAFVRNTYRVLLTRARYETVIWVPRGDGADATRPPEEMNAIAARLIACGARPLEGAEQIGKELGKGDELPSPDPIPPFFGDLAPDLAVGATRPAARPARAESWREARNSASCRDRPD